MIEEFIDSALIIDDKSKEIKGLEDFLNSKDIWVKHYTPDELNRKSDFLKNKKIIFLDLYIDETKSKIEEQVALIRKTFKKTIGLDFGTYGIVLWTKHMDEMDEFKKRIQNDYESYCLPLFIVGLDKTKYIQADNFNSIFDDLNEKIQNNTAASFFIQWCLLVEKGKDNAITNIYRLVNDFEKQDQNLKFFLLQLAQNYTGIPNEKIKEYDLYVDAFKAFSDMLHYEVVNSNIPKSKLFENISEIIYLGNDSDKQKIFSEINSKLLLDFINIKQNNIIPGNVYEIIEDINYYKIVDVKLKKNKKEEVKKVSEVFNNVQHIIIEVTPPCDFAQNKSFKKSRILGGILFDFMETDKPKEYFKGESYYSEVYPVQIKGKDNPQMMVFDFRYFGTISEDDLKESAKYKILFKVKDRLFADILQKLSSHIARLGLSIIH